MNAANLEALRDSLAWSIAAHIHASGSRRVRQATIDIDNRFIENVDRKAHEIARYGEYRCWLHDRRSDGRADTQKTPLYRTIEDQRQTRSIGKRTSAAATGSTTDRWR